ncbi:MAG: hypothetical protein ACE5HD_06040 [Acidobacteriota bacterium]
MRDIMQKSQTIGDAKFDSLPFRIILHLPGSGTRVSVAAIQAILLEQVCHRRDQFLSQNAKCPDAPPGRNTIWPD